VQRIPNEVVMEDRIIRPSVFGACNPLRTLMFGMAILVGLSFTNASIGDEPQWIWSPKQTTVNGGASHGDCYFRKKFTLIRPMKAELEIAAGDEYEVYINEANRLVHKPRSMFPLSCSQVST
jgi:hypothetical protein